MLRSIEGLDKVEIIRPGYAIEYDYIDPVQLKPSLETRLLENLFFAGQVNGTSGYEEAASQGLLAGINASLKIKKMDPLILGREEGYIGVLIDDLVTKGTREPYRMFTSRAEYRLLLREDNADLRLREKGRSVGLVNDQDYFEFVHKKNSISKELIRIAQKIVYPTQGNNDQLKILGSSPIKNPLSLSDLLRRPEISHINLKLFDPICALSDPVVAEQVEIQVKYAGYLQRQEEQLAQFLKLERMVIPENIDFRSIPALTAEVKEKLERIKPISLGQAARISGVTPASITTLMIYLKKIDSLGKKQLFKRMDLG
jgi:tRNA uridine 5-carboxymethylaminomethyl modification enzyme